MKYKVNNIVVNELGIIINITQKKLIGKKFWIFNRYKTKRFFAFRMFKNISINPNISYTDWLIIDKNSMDKNSKVINPKYVIKNPELIKVLNKILLKTKSIKKVLWKKDI